MNPEPPSPTDEELACDSQAGSLAAFEQLVYRYEHRVHAFVSQYCRNLADAGEVTQDTFVKAFQSLAQFDSGRAFAPWLFTIARRKCIDRHRSAPPIAEEAGPELADDNDPAELAARSEDRRNLWATARRQLSDSQFQALWLHYAEDMEVAQIAEVLGKTRIHIKVLLFRARHILGRGLKPATRETGRSRPKTQVWPAAANHLPAPDQLNVRSRNL